MTDESKTHDVDLSGKGLTNLSTLKKYDRGKLKSLNLHNNMLNEMSDLPRFLFLTELNISSNRFKFVPDLSFLPALTSLDVSGNVIVDLVSLSYLPALKKLKLAFNNIKSLQGLTRANVPDLEYLDLRGNEIVPTDYEVKPIGTLLKLKKIVIETKDTNTIAMLFTTCRSLEFVDHKSEDEWKSLILKKQKEEAPTPSIQPVVINLPHFDKVAAMYRNAHSTADSAQKGKTVASPVSRRPAAGSPVQSPYHSRTRANPKPSSPSFIPLYVHPSPPETLDGKYCFLSSILAFCFFSECFFLSCSLLSQQRVHK